MGSVSVGTLFVDLGCAGGANARCSLYRGVLVRVVALAVLFAPFVHPSRANAMPPTIASSMRDVKLMSLSWDTLGGNPNNGVYLYDQPIAVCPEKTSRVGQRRKRRCAPEPSS